MNEPTVHPVSLTRRGRRVRLTRTQSEIWTSQRLHPDVPLANMAHRYSIEGPLDPARLASAFAEVVAASDALRLVVEPGATEGLVVDHVPKQTELIDLPADEAGAWCEDRISRVIDVADCVYDSVILRHDDAHWTWWLDIHHLATDAWSAALVFEATARLYATADDSDGERLRAAAIIDGDYFDLHEPTTVDTVPGTGSTPVSTTVRLAPYGPRGPRTTAVDRTPLEFTDEARDAIDDAIAGPFRSLSRELSTLALAAMAAGVTVYRLEGRTELVVGVPVHHRSATSTKRVIGPMMELFPLTVVVDSGETVQEWFRGTIRSIMTLLRSARAGEVDPVEFEVVLNVLTERFDDFAGMATTATWVRSGHVDPNHVIRCHVFDHSTASEGDGRGRARWQVDVNRALSADGAADGFAAQFAAAIEALVASSETTVGDLDLHTVGDAAASRALNPDPAIRPVLRPVHEVVAQRLALDPSAIVAEQAGRTVRADEFDRRVDALARHLVRHGLPRGGRVGLRMRRSVDVLVAIQGVLRAGGAFVMLAPDDPASRHDAIERDADLFVVLDRIPARDGERADEDVELPTVGLDDAAYVLYTSGSTGQPKGVPISHRGLADYLAFAVDAYVEPGAAPVVALHSELVFDLTITGLFIGLFTGGRTVVFDAAPIEALGEIAADDRISFLKATPSQLEIFNRLAAPGRPLRVVVVGGEAFRRPVAERLAASCEPGLRIFNEYGPTEAVVGCMIHEWDPARDTGPDVPIGRAAPGTQLLALDHLQTPAPPGAWAELYVRRPGMASGYLNRPELSAERFVHLSDDLVETAVGSTDGWRDIPWYATGDRVRFDANGTLVYGGRSDDQLKVNGIRLEPGEVEAALVSHPAIVMALVGSWNPARHDTEPRRCVRCGLGDDVPGTTLDATGVCNVCHSFDAVAPQAQAWFKTEADLDAELRRARVSATGDADCLHLLSGGKDSTYALYQLVERGWRVHALTLDNGFISDGAKENVRRSIADLGITHEFATTATPEVMNEIFRDSLDRHSNVCQGCYKTIYTLAVARARELGIPVIVTGLSRGQFFETRLVPHQFEADRFDPVAIDRTVLEARRVYHSSPDAVTRLLPEQRVFDDPAVLDEIEFVDFYRYVDVDLAELYDFLEQRAPWVRPADTGRSTNCLINVAGIQVHRGERGYHSYAEPYSWDVRLGHKTREEALEELDDDVDDDEVAQLLAEVGYEPKDTSVLTAWYRSADGSDLDPDELRRHLRTLVPEHAVPSAFVRIDDIPLAASAKADLSQLPAPTRFHRRGVDVVAPSDEIEARLCEIWAEVLGLETVGVTDDFFDLGGASLSALEVVAAVDAAFATDLPDAIVFRTRTIRELARSVGAAHRDGASGAPIEALDADAPPPLSAGQQAMLFEYRMAPDDTRYNVTRLYTIDNRVDPERLADAFRDVAVLHEPLHRAYDAARTDLGGGAVDFELLDDHDAERFREFAEQQKRRPFDLDLGPLVRVHLAHVAEQTTMLLVGIHHVAIDAGTLDVLWEQVERRYHGDAVPAPAVTFGAHAEWQRARLDAAHAGDIAFWRARNDARSTSPGLALEAPRSAEPDGYLSRPLAIGAEQLSGGGATPFARSLAAAAATVSRCSSRTSVEIGVTASTRDHPSCADLVGYFLNTLPVEIPVARSATFADLVETAGTEIAEVLPHRRTPFAAIVDDARAAGSVEPSASIMLAFEELADASFGSADARHEILASGTAVADVTLFVQLRSSRVDVGIEHRGAVVSRCDAERMLDAFASLLERGVASPDRPVDDLLGLEVEPDLVGEVLGDVPTTVLARFVAQLSAAPDVPAVVHGDGVGAEITLSYRDVARRVEALADRLDRALLGDGDERDREVRVGVDVRRSAEVVVAMLAAMASGGVYVPLDPSTPRTRLDHIVDAASLDIVVTDDPGRWSGRGAPRVLTVNDPSTTDVVGAGDGSAVDRLRGRVAQIAPDDVAYVIFTSGSTGTPRGVEITHASLAASTVARDVWYDAQPSRFLVTSSIGFDSSIVGLFWPLATGGAVVIPSDDVVHDVDRLGVLVDQLGVSHVLMVPSLYDALLRRRSDRLAGLSTAIVAGEQCPRSVVEAHHDRSAHVELVNEYGPTEATVWASAHRLVPDDERVLIGGPIPGVTLRVAADDLAPVVRGATGELLIAGPGLARGYLGKASLTRERFVERDGRRWYRTGDVVRVHGSAVEFVGRADDQLNIGGNRLEPAEVEAALRTFEAVDEAVVVAVGEPAVLVAHIEVSPTDEPGHPRHDVDEAQLRRRLADLLPARSIPRRIVAHRRLPRTAHGKIDRQAAAALDLDGRTPGGLPTDTNAPTEATLDAVVASFARVFGCTVDPDDDFFAAGGDSLVAVALISDLAESVGRDVGVSALLSAPTPRSLAAHLGAPGGTPASSGDGTIEVDVEFPIVTLRAGDPHGPLVITTPAWDDIFGYRDLADSFGDDVTVLAAVYEEQRGRPVVGTVDELVAAFVPRLVDVTASRSSVAVVGWSIGGVVAAELGDRLRDAGGRVGVIALIDTFFPGQDRHLWSNRWWKYKSMLGPGVRREAVREAKRMGRRRVERLAARAGRALMAWAGAPAPPEPERTSLGGFPTSALRHEITRVDTPMVVYAANTTNPERTVNRWREITQRLEVVPVEGRHRGFESIMDTGRVEQITCDLSARLQRAD